MQFNNEYLRARKSYLEHKPCKIVAFQKYKTCMQPVKGFLVLEEGRATSWERTGYTYSLLYVELVFL